MHLAPREMPANVPLRLEPPFAKQAAPGAIPHRHQRAAVDRSVQSATPGNCGSVVHRARAMVILYKKPGLVYMRYKFGTPLARSDC
jgi:hypothetical protein